MKGSRHELAHQLEVVLHLDFLLRDLFLLVLLEIVGEVVHVELLKEVPFASHLLDSDEGCSSSDLRKV